MKVGSLCMCLTLMSTNKAVVFDDLGCVPLSLKLMCVIMAQKMPLCISL